jgi:hypothetical protein
MATCVGLSFIFSDIDMSILASYLQNIRTPSSLKIII